MYTEYKKKRTNMGKGVEYKSSTSKDIDKIIKQNKIKKTVINA